MQETNTVNQLNQALNELLNAYDKLKYENKQLNEKVTNLESTISELENSKNELEETNKDLETQIATLSDTTKHNSNEIDTMLGRIKSILDTTKDEDPLEEEVEDVINEEIYSEPTPPSAPQEIDENPNEPKPLNAENNNKNEIDLGRIQSLLNGFN